MIFHIFGGQCSGKTSVVNKLDPERFAHWDILEDFYIPKGIIKDNQMDWDSWREHKDEIGKDIKEFAVQNSNKHLLIESSGLNKKINETIKQLGTVTPINMGVPSEKESIKRAKARGFSSKQVKDFNSAARFRFARLSEILPSMLSIDEAVALIIEKEETDK